jgi:NAD(P)-dependent dehydrogenase (short-subunit alcohol dehydrogenase family)
MPGLVPGIHVLIHVAQRKKTWMAGTSPAMTRDVSRSKRMRLAGKTAIVTGGARGIGRHYSQALAAAGARVMIADIADGKDLAAEIAQQHGANSATSVTFDVSDESGVKSLVAQTMERFGQIDILVNNAALYATLTPRNYDEWDAEVWDKVMAINVRGPYLMVRHVAPHMIARKSGKIINIASGAAYKGVPRMLPYVTSKGAMLAFTRSLSRDYILSDTGLANTTHVEEERLVVRNSRAFKRDGYPEDLLGALVFLASSDSDFVTGQSLVVDGGSVNN